MTNTSREVGGVFGIALLGTILFTKLNARARAGARRDRAQPPSSGPAIAAAASHGAIDPRASG